MAKQPDNDLPGTWHGGLSAGPAREAVEFLNDTDDYTRKMRYEAGGGSIFRAHPGVKTTMVTDQAAMEAMFYAPASVLDREEVVGFGCLTLNYKELLNGTVPALVSNESNHGSARGVVDRAMRSRGRSALEAPLKRTLDDGWSAIRHTSSQRFEHAIIETAVGMTFSWLFGLDEGPDGPTHDRWLQACFGLKVDGFISTALAGLGATLKGKQKPDKEMQDHSARWLAAIKGSAPFQDFVSIGEELDLGPDEVAAHLMFAAGFNGAGGTFTTAFPALCQIYTDLTLRAELAEELAPFSENECARMDAREAIEAIVALPILNGVFLETMRLYGRPRQYYRVAKEDILLPTSDGQRVPIKKGTRLGLVATVAHQDPALWGIDASRFNPSRYDRRPELKERVHAWGPPSTGGSPYGCAGGANGSAERIWKVLVASMARDPAWCLDPMPRPDIDAFAGVEPDSFEWYRTRADMPDPD